MSDLSEAISPPHIVIGVVPGDRSGRDTFLAVCRLLLGVGAAPTALAEASGEGSAARFEFVSDLAENTVVIAAAGIIAVEARDPLRVWFRHPEVGAIYVSYGRASREVSHPITVTVSGASTDGWDEVAPTRAERDRSETVRAFVSHIFTSICAELTPFYASVQIEDSVPAPADLLDEGASVGTILFVSRSALDVAPGLVEQLTALFRAGTTRRVPNGLMTVDSAFLDPGQAPAVNAVCKGRTAARLLGQAFTRLNDAGLNNAAF